MEAPAEKATEFAGRAGFHIEWEKKVK